MDNPLDSDGKRGKDKFIPISWDKAFEIASKELLRIKKILATLQFMLALMVGQVQEDFIMLKVKLIDFLIYLAV